MSWWGKVIGGALGFAVVGPIGALLGAAIGHSFDKGLSGLDGFSPNIADQEKVQAAFFTATFTIMGRVAKADGKVSKEEIAVAQQTMARMQLDIEQTAAAQRLFTKGKEETFNFTEVAQQLRKECGRNKNLLQMFLEIQIATALADGDLHQQEQGILVELAAILGFSQFQFQRLLAMAVAQSRFYKGSESSHGFTQQGYRINEAYEVLGVESTCTDQELKRAYRRLMSQHHPDKLVAKGLPEEMMKLATEKTQQIKDAYDTIKQHRQE